VCCYLRLKDSLLIIACFIRNFWLDGCLRYLCCFIACRCYFETATAGVFIVIYTELVEGIKRDGALTTEGIVVIESFTTTGSVISM
jgi:hypothetical protein